MEVRDPDPAAAALAALDALRIAYTRYDHPPVFTVEEAEAHWRDIDATQCKNLFLRNKKGTRHYLVVAERHATVGSSGSPRSSGTIA